MTVGDHPAMRVGGPLASLTAIAMVTERLRVGSYVLCSEFRDPALLVREVATLDYVSGGRVEVGLGAGWLETDFDAIGRGMEPAGVRFARLDESLQILAAALDGRTKLSYDGHHFRVTSALGTWVQDSAGGPGRVPEWPGSSVK